MSRIKAIKVEEATGKTAELYSAIKSSLGGVPNIFQALGTSPHVLETFLGFGAAVKSLSAAEKESLALAVAQSNSCNYCLAAHTAIGKKVGLADEQIVSARRAQSGDKKIDALVKLAREIVTEKGHISDATYKNFISAGYTETQVPEVVLAVVQNIFTNYFNHVNQTEIDFPAAQKI